jgi:hypothetical protein
VVPPHIRRAVEQRDRHCVFTGCAAPTHWCDVHHPATPRGPRRARESWGGSGPFAHQGPPRVPDRTRSRRPMAHLPPRRHRDPHRTPSSGLSSPSLSAHGRGRKAAVPAATASAAARALGRGGGGAARLPVLRCASGGADDHCTGSAGRRPGRVSEDRCPVSRPTPRIPSAT